MTQAKTTTTTTAAAATTKPIKAKQKQMLTGYSCMSASEIVSTKNNNNKKKFKYIYNLHGTAGGQASLNRERERWRGRESKVQGNGMRVYVCASTNI